MNKRKIGEDAEIFAEKYLKKLKYKIIEKNYRTKFGEIDIIGIDKSYLVFVEVKMRTNEKFGNILYSIDKKKMNKIIKAAKFFLTANKRKYNKFDIRFDVILLENKRNSQYKITLIKNAFDADI